MKVIDTKWSKLFIKRFILYSCSKFDSRKCISKVSLFKLFLPLNANAKALLISSSTKFIW